MSWNLNGIRAATRNGFFEWLDSCEADVVLLQEVRALPEQIPEEQLEIHGYHSIWKPAEKKGYSGCAIYTKLPKDSYDTVMDMGAPEFDSEGRFVGIIHDDILYGSAYFPNSQRGGARLPYKLDYCNTLHHFLQDKVEEGVDIVLGGDYNIAHTAIDLANPKTNEKNAGYLPEERDWMTHFLSEGFVDTFRMFEEDGGHYTWWSQRKGVRERNIGWRIDYHCVNENLQQHVANAEIHPNTLGSDHCPISLELSL